VFNFYAPFGKTAMDIARKASETVLLAKLIMQFRQ